MLTVANYIYTCDLYFKTIKYSTNHYNTHKMNFPMLSTFSIWYKTHKHRTETLINLFIKCQVRYWFLGIILLEIHALTHSHLQQIWRRLRKPFGKKMDNLCIVVYLLEKVENIVTKGEIACFEKFLLLFQCFQKSQRRQKATICGKALKFERNQLMVEKL